MDQSGFWEKLKDFSTIAAGAGVLLYVLGYTVHVVHYFHVLGIDIPIQPLEYIRTGGDFCASILISIPQLFTSVDYFSSLSHDASQGMKVSVFLEQCSNGEATKS